MHEYNARKLYDLILENDIKNVLDLGTGIGASAAIMALALKTKGVDFKIITIEQSQKCFDLAQDLMPEELKQYVEFHLIDPVMWDNKSIPYDFFSIFTKLPENQWDFIVVDGPGPFLQEEWYLDFANGDIMKMLVEGKLIKGSKIFFDGRLNALRALERYYSDNFYLLNPVNNEYNILEVKDSTPKFFDTKKEAMKQKGYFEKYDRKTTSGEEKTVS